MSNSPQILGQVTNGVSLQLSRADSPADSPTVAIERPNLSFPRPRIRARMVDSWILKNAEAPKMDDKMSLDSSGTDRDRFMKPSDVDPSWDEVIPADKLADIKAKKEEKQHEAYVAKVVAENAPRRVARKSRNRERNLKYRSRKAREEQQDVEYYTQDSLLKPELSPRDLPEGGHKAYIAKIVSEDAPRRVSLDPYSASTPGLRPTRPLEFGHAYPLTGPNGSILPHSSTDKLLNCRIRSTHYTISQDHTFGKEAHKDDLLASFGKRQRTEKPSISLGESRLFHRSTNRLANLSSDDDVVAQNEGSGLEESSIAGVDVFDFLAPLGSQIPEDAVSFPGEVATTKPNEGKDIGDEVEVVQLEAQFRTKNPTLPPNQIRQMAIEHLARLKISQRVAMNPAAKGILAARIATLTSPHQYAAPSTQMYGRAWLRADAQMDAQEKRNRLKRHQATR